MASISTSAMRDFEEKKGVATIMRIDVREVEEG
jgi:hypothetical protein